MWKKKCTTGVKKSRFCPMLDTCEDKKNKKQKLFSVVFISVYEHVSNIQTSLKVYIII